VADESWPEPSGAATDVTSTSDLAAMYLTHVRSVLPQAASLGNLRIAVDCANGATTDLAPRLLRECGLDVMVTGNHPDGRNINQDCGSTHPERLAEMVTPHECRIGIAFDGDGDRAIFVDHRGRLVDGDAVMFLCAKQMLAERRLKGNAVVATVMSNIGLELALREEGIGLVRCPVGDKYVMEELLARGLALGGEQSGHVIFPEYVSTGDGLATSLYVLRTMLRSGRELADLASDLTTYPQVLVNVRVKEKTDLAEVPPIAAVMADVDRKLAGSGRLLVRYSGTEPLLRIMLEGKDQSEITRWAEDIAHVVRERLG
jgi:phosphoglucosamine mutase